MAFDYRGGVLCAEYVSLEEIARRFGTPCYVYSRSAIERALILHPGEGLESLDVAPEAGLAAPAASGDSELNLREVLNRRERELLLEAQKRAQGVRKEAARLLGIDPRNLAYYLRKHGLPIDPPGGQRAVEPEGSLKEDS